MRPSPGIGGGTWLTHRNMPLRKHVIMLNFIILYKKCENTYGNPSGKQGPLCITFQGPTKGHLSSTYDFLLHIPCTTFETNSDLIFSTPCI